MLHARPTHSGRIAGQYSTKSNGNESSAAAVRKPGSLRSGLPFIPLSPRMTSGPVGLGHRSDSAERHADTIADKTVSSAASTNGSIANTQAISVGGQSARILSNRFSSHLHGSLGGGNPLSSTVREDLEPRLGFDLGGIRVHSDKNARALSRSLNAQAFAYRSDIFFDSGKYRPESHDGRKLLAHELGHVVQARGNTISRKSAEEPANDAAKDAGRLHAALEQMGTDEDTVYHILEQPPSTVIAIKRYYEENLNTLTGKGLLADLSDEFSGSELGRVHVLLASSGVAQSPGESTKQLAEKSYAAMEQVGTDEDEIYRILSYPGMMVRAMINIYNEHFSITGNGFVADIHDEFSGDELKEALRLLNRSGVKPENRDWKRTTLSGAVPGEPDKLWAGLIVRGKGSFAHSPGLGAQHADVVVSDPAGQLQARGRFAETGVFAGGSSSGAARGTGQSTAAPSFLSGVGEFFNATGGMGIKGVSADMDWFLSDRPWYVVMYLAKQMQVRSTLILMKISKKQAARFTKYWVDMKKDPGTFDILGKNCSTAAAAGFSKIDLTGEIAGLDTPNNLFQQLREKYKQAYMISGFFGYERDGLAGMPDPKSGKWRWTWRRGSSWRGPFVDQRILK